jgi:hypothetical protein
LTLLLQADVLNKDINPSEIFFPERPARKRVKIKGLCLVAKIQKRATGAATLTGYTLTTETVLEKAEKSLIFLAPVEYNSKR